LGDHTISSEGNDADTRRVAIIGPVLPYRGGISQHTTLLARAMATRCTVDVFSFRRQYPAGLYPGHSDRDPDYLGHREENTRYVLDSLNPWTWRRVARDIEKGGYSQVVFPWWTVFWFFCFGYLSYKLKRTGLDIIFLCHNVVEHESAWWKTLLTRWVLRNASRFLVHTRRDEANLRQLLPGSRIAEHPHPIYDQFPAPSEPLPRRGRLELLFYGFVRPYKGLDDLLAAMSMLRRQDVFLTVAGEFWKGSNEAQKLVEDYGIQDRIELRARYHSERESADLFARADVIVLPYRSATGSGVLSLAYHYNRPVLVTRVGGLPDVVDPGITGWIVEPSSPRQLADVIGAIDTARLEDMQGHVAAYKQSLSWESLASALLDGQGFGGR
jgi:glycosyltransferase involved in cell wall biosynthesis